MPWQPGSSKRYCVVLSHKHVIVLYYSDALVNVYTQGTPRYEQALKMCRGVCMQLCIEAYCLLIFTADTTISGHEGCWFAAENLTYCVQIKNLL